MNFECQCGADFKTMEELWIHKGQTGHHPLGESIPAQKDIRVNEHNCKQCAKSFQTARQLRTHELVHIEKKECPHCHELFLPAGLIHHMEIHEDKSFALIDLVKGNYICKICRLSLSSKEKVFRHIRDKHPDSISQSKGERSWERRLDESNKAFIAFVIYRGLGSARSLERTRDELDRKAGYVRVLAEWSSRFDWVKRAEAFDTHMDIIRLEALEKVVGEDIKKASKRPSQKRVAHAKQEMDDDQIAMILWDRMKKLELEEALPLFRFVSLLKKNEYAHTVRTTSPHFEE